MLFNSLQYAIFLPIVLFIYWFVVNKSLKLQNLFLLIVSCLFYSFWDWRFLFLLIFSILICYYPGLKIASAKNIFQKRLWLWISVIINVGFLGFFKYYNFFIESFAEMLSFLGLQANISTLNIILPVGISFYTFHGLSYVIDLYYDRIRPEKNFVNYSLFVSYFPLLVAGPIERATHLLPQINKRRQFSYNNAVSGLKQILWGLVKKVIIADQCAMFANQIFDNPGAYSGSTLFLGAVFFAFQIYGDFSGYSDIALGTSRLLGIELLKNFSYPYFSRDIAEFWRRWHISLSSWFKDYLYIPLGGSRGGMWMRVRNTFIIFLVSGFWHGANWTFIAWGAVNALFIMPSIIFNTNRKNIEIVAKGKFWPGMRDMISIAITFTITVFIWIFFRAETIGGAFDYISGIFRTPLGLPQILPKTLLLLIFVFMLIEWTGRASGYAIEEVNRRMPRYISWPFYYLLIYLIFLYSSTGSQQFIYFQF